jgi:hypothetical protein
VSYGIVICSMCQREVHQDGDENVERGWRHCEDGTPRCIGSTSDYPESESQIKGRWCGRDRGPGGIIGGRSEVERLLPFLQAMDRTRDPLNPYGGVKL